MIYTNKDVQDFYNHQFDFNNQHKTDYNDWLEAFKKSIAKRGVDGCFMGLSSGYDSGSVSKELSKQGIDVKVYTMFNNENKEIIENRLKYLPNNVVSEMSRDLWGKYYDFLKDKIHPVDLADHASMGVAYMFDTAKAEGKSICICCQGGDEIISDYALYPGQSTYKGVFPEDLKEWANFKGGMNEIYIREIESIAALYGIECRYPFLDVDLVQEYLWLSADLKNKNYKAPLYEYLVANNVPFEPNVKRGFNPINKEAI